MPRMIIMSSARPRMPPSRSTKRLGPLGRPRGPHQVARAIANHRRAGAAERGENQVRQLAFLGRVARFDGDELGDEFGFVDVQAAAGGVGESPRPDFGRSAVIDDARIPGRFDPLADGRHAAARLAGDDDFFDRQVGQVDVVLGGHFGQAQRVGRRAEKRRDFDAANQFDAGQAAQAAAGNHQRAARDQARRTRSKTR